MTDAYGGSGKFEWNLDKAHKNAVKHRMTFEEAMSAFRDPISLVIPDLNHTEDEDRLILLGYSDHQRLIVVVYTERDNKLRLISARAATLNERRKYEKEANYGY